MSAPFDADQDRRDEAEEMSWLQLSFYFGRESAVEDGKRRPARRGVVVPILSRTCRHCRVRFQRLQGLVVSLARHEARCILATRAEREVWKKRGRWPTLTKARRAYMRARRGELVGRGLCVTCKSPTQINPETSKPYSRCEGHRAQQRTYMDGYRRAA